MSRLMRLGAIGTGNQTHDLARKLHSLIIGQDTAIHSHKIVKSVGSPPGYRSTHAGLDQQGLKCWASCHE
jgi:hypothetical protein